MSIDWTTISTIASTVAIVMGGFLWLFTKVFHLGQTTQRLDSIEADVQLLKIEVRAIRTELSQRIDQLIFAIAESRDLPRRRSTSKKTTAE